MLLLKAILPLPKFQGLQEATQELLPLRQLTLPLGLFQEATLELL